MGLLDKIKVDLYKNLKVSNSAPLKQAVEVEPILLMDAINDDENVLIADDNDYLFPFKSREEMRDRATELRVFFSETVLPEKRTIFGRATIIQNPKSFIENILRLMANYWHDQLYIKDRICDLLFLKQCFEQKRML